MRRMRIKTKKGAASFYIVAFSTLILLVVATSFATVIISEIERTSNEDLSQSAYDSAMAGLEDAKLAYYNYQNCVAQGYTQAGADLNDGAISTCEDIISVIRDNQSCDMTAQILGRAVTDGGVMVREANNNNNNMQQYYTCAKINTVLKDYRASLSGSEQMRVIKTKFASDKEGVNVTDLITKVKISWYENDGTSYAYKNFLNSNVAFQRLVTTTAAVPPTIALAMLQTSETFHLSDFNVTQGQATDRGMVYLVPTGINAQDNNNSTYKKSSWDGKTNNISKDAFLKSNNKTATNLPYTVYCPPSTTDEGKEAEFACSATIELPKPIVTDANRPARNQDTFIFVVALPYGTPYTDFALEFFCSDGATDCAITTTDEDGVASTDTSGQAYLDSVQVEIDSTGRANDLYRRVKTRVQTAADSSYLSLMGPLELLGENAGGEDLLNKTDTVKCEYNFVAAPTC